MIIHETLELNTSSLSNFMNIPDSTIYHTIIIVMIMILSFYLILQKGTKGVEIV